MNCRLMMVSVFLGLLSVVGMLATQETAASQQQGKQEKLSAFDALPHNTVGFVSFRFHDIWRHKLVDKLRNAKSDEIQTQLAKLKGEVGLTLDEIERFTPFVTSAGSEAVLIAATKPINQKTLSQNIDKDVLAKVYNGKTYYRVRYQAMYFVGDRQFVMGSARSIESYIDAAIEKKKSPLGPHLTAQAAKRTIFGAINMVEFKKVNGVQFPPQLQQFLSADAGTFWLDVDNKKVTGQAEAMFSSDKDAKAAVPAGENLVTLICTELERGIQMVERYELKNQKTFVQYMRDLNAVLRKAKIEQQGKKLVATAETDINWKKANLAMDELVKHLHDSSLRIKRTLNLRQIGLAMHTYHDAHRFLPPQAVVDKNGKPLLSWRVLILPYIEEGELYKQFRLNEPWDSPHNYKLLSKMPKIYEPPVQKGRRSYKTHYQVVAGKDTMFDGQQKITLAGITDGTSNTIMVVEAKKAVHWSKPEDVEFVPGKMMPKLGGLFDGGFNTLFGDGSVHFVRDKIGENTLRLLLLRNDGMAIPQEAFER